MKNIIKGIPRTRLSEMFLCGLAMLVSFVTLQGCVSPPQAIPYTPHPTTMPRPAHCFDTVGHMAGSKPFVLSGTCCCTPTEKVLADYKNHRHVSQDMTLQQLIALHEKAGIRTAREHQSCNNLCQWGPHVIKGGKCMAPPTPGTYNFEEVRFGVRYVPVKKGDAPITEVKGENPPLVK